MRSRDQSRFSRSILDGIVLLTQIQDSFKIRMSKIDNVIIDVPKIHYLQIGEWQRGIRLLFLFFLLVPNHEFSSIVREVLKKRMDANAASAGPGEFYLRYFSGRRGRYGYESLEFEVKPDGEVRSNN